jgi:glycine oxidase
VNASSGGDVAVVGGGLIGLAIAFELCERGARVRLYDAGTEQAASWAGAGMLAPYTEDLHDDALRQLCARSLERYPDFCRRVGDASGVDPNLHLDGIVHAAFDDDALDALGSRARALSAGGVACRMLDRTQTLATEPWLGSHVRGALLIAGEGRVDNRRLQRALIAACAARGVVIETGAPVQVECDRRRVLGVSGSAGFTPARAVVNACGVRAGVLGGLPADVRPPILPVKGQMLALQIPTSLVRRSAWVPGAYVVPRDDGRLLVGATVEPGVDDVRVTAGGMGRLLSALLAAAPSLADFAVVETWAGVRPGSADGRPFVGPTAIDGLYTAAGHYRNGILLAPLTAELIARWIAGEEPPEMAAFAPGRLESAEAGAKALSCAQRSTESIENCPTA